MTGRRPTRANADRAALVELARLYATLLELREGSARGEAKPASSRFRALASELPGALRLLDQMPLGDLSTRAAELERLAADPTAVPAWIESTLAWRSVMRAALAVRRAAGRERSVVRAREAIARLDETVHETAHTELEAIVRPEEGRLVVWALGRVGEAVGRAPEAVEREVFGVVRASTLTRTAADVAPVRPRSRTHR